MEVSWSPGGVRGRRPFDGLLGQLPTVELPLLATAVEQLHVLVPVQLEIPVRVRREPVVVTAIQHHGVVVADAAFAEQLLELFLADEVAANLVLQVGLPVELDGTGDVTTVIRGSVFVDLDEDDSGGGLGSVRPSRPRRARLRGSWRFSSNGWMWLRPDGTRMGCRDSITAGGLGWLPRAPAKSARATSPDQYR